MDINALLSPTETPRSSSQTPSATVNSSQSVNRRPASGPAKHGVVASPLSQSVFSSSSIPNHVLSPRQSNKSSSPMHSPQAGATSSGQTSRNSSSMDTLADLASMQNHQPTRLTPPVLRSRESYESQLSPSTIFPNVPAVSVTSNPRPSFDVAMADTSRTGQRSDFMGTSLPLEVQQRASMLVKSLQERPSAFVNHTELINILHQGFVNHVYPPSSPNAHGDPHVFDLLPDLRLARENMHKLFAMGEDLWMDCLRDESMLARNNDEKLAVTNKCLDAIAEEHGSVKLWKMYGEWMLHCYNSAHGSGDTNGSTEASEEEQILGQATFTWDLVVETWRQAVDSTQWRVRDSHEIWDQYISALARAPSNQESAAAIRRLFEERLRTPHAKWDDTFQSFSSFISNSPFQHDYERIMVDVNKLAADAKAQWSARELLEMSLQRAQDAGDSDAEYTAFADYIQWEQTPEKHKRLSFDLTNAIFQRAELRFPSDASLWEDHIMWLIENRQADANSEQVLSTLERATRHCPWAGSLWSQYLLTSEKERHPFSETENIKHKATSTGLLDVGGIEEVLRVHAAWCNYLRRRAFRSDASDEDLDVAEMGIRSSIENVQELATKLGQAQRPDGQFRLERIYINFLSDSGSWDSAKEAFRGLIPKFGDSFEFWLRFYEWEMMRWRKFVRDEYKTDSGQLVKAPGPHFATAVLREAVKRPNLDQPEQMIQRLISHCEDYEDVEELQQAIVDSRKVEKTLAARMQVEVQQGYIANGPEGNQDAEMVIIEQPTGKRKRAEAEVVADTYKRLRYEESVLPSTEQDRATEEPLKRDREHATVTVHNIPDDISDTRIRQFFRDCGTINSVKVLHDRSRTALVEFEDFTSAEYALTRSGKDLDGSTVEVQLESGSTLYVTNYPPTTGEVELREMFEQFGEIVDIRLPSLKGNAGRRFSYVQFKAAGEAHRALDMDGFEVEGLKMSVNISDPSRKQERSGPADDGRQLFVRNIAFKTSEKDLDRKFSKFGEIETVKIPHDDKGRSKGYGFVTFSSAEHAEAALEMDGQDFKGRAVQVSIARKPGSKHQATIRAGRSNSPAQNGDAGSPATMSVPSPGEKDMEDRRARTIALVNVPDTVNVSRIRSIAEPHGNLVKVNLQVAHQGAILEYEDAGSAGKAALALEAFEIAPGRALRVTTVPEMLKEEPEMKVDKIQVGKKAGLGLQSTQIRRPAQPGQRKAGGLGQKVLSSRKAESNGENVNVEGSSKVKSNADFRAMFK